MSPWMRDQIRMFVHAGLAMSAVMVFVLVCAWVGGVR